MEAQRTAASDVGGVGRGRAVLRSARVLVVAGFFLGAAWLRLSSLGGTPMHCGDESYLGIQVTKMLRGESFRIHTPTGNLVGPFYAAVLVPLHLVGEPSLWMLRLPAALSGALAMALVYALGARTLGRRTSAIAAGALAAMPAAVCFSRIGCEFTQTPLVAVLALHCAFRANGVGLLLSLGAALLVHPTSVFLVPIVLPVFFVRLVGRNAADPARRKRLLLAGAMTTIVLGGAVAARLLQHTVVREFLRKPKDWGEFLRGLETFFLYLYLPVSRQEENVHRWTFRVVVALLLMVGLPGLVRARRLDRLALLGGLVGSLAMFHFLAGSQVWSIQTNRYGAVFLAPAALAFAFLADSALAQVSVWAAARGRLAARLALDAALVVGLLFGWALLASVKLNWLDRFALTTHESIVTFGPEWEDDFAQALRHIKNDTTRRGVEGRPILVLAQEYWCGKPLEYLAGFDDSMKVVTLVDIDSLSAVVVNGPIVEQKKQRLLEAMKAGAYAVELPTVPRLCGGGLIQDALATLPADRVERWSLVQPGGSLALIVYRLSDEPTQTALKTR